jgi:ubiquinone/menaquinone biosynthesis C-methylase UbiE
MQRSSQTAPEPSLSFLQRFLFLILRRFFDLLYHQLAWTYDWVAAIVSFGAWQEWILSVIPYLPGPRILEIGFGRGHLQAALSRHGCIVVGLDESPQMAGLANHKLRRSGLRPNLTRGEAVFLPFPGLSFDQIVLTFPAEFIMDPGVLTEIHRVLVGGGQAVILPMAWITGRSPLERALAWINRITGEAPDFNEKSLLPLMERGFQVSWEILPLGRSNVLIIKMIKSP